MENYQLKQLETGQYMKVVVRKLEAAPVTMTGGTPHAYLLVRDSAMHGLGIGTMHDMKSVIGGLFFPSLQSRDYTSGEKINTWRGKFQSGVSALWDEVLTTDLSQEVTEFKIPIYFFHGIYDYTVSYSEAKSYFEKIQAPVKGFYRFEQSAHTPMLEEPEKVQKILQEDVLTGAHHLADR